jgi:hypothetical protein
MTANQEDRPKKTGIFEKSLTYLCFGVGISVVTQGTLEALNISTREHFSGGMLDPYLSPEMRIILGGALLGYATSKIIRYSRDG